MWRGLLFVFLILNSIVGYAADETTGILTSKDSGTIRASLCSNLVNGTITGFAIGGCAWVAREVVKPIPDDELIPVGMEFIFGGVAIGGLLGCIVTAYNVYQGNKQSVTKLDNTKTICSP